MTLPLGEGFVNALQLYKVEVLEKAFSSWKRTEKIR